MITLAQRLDVADTYYFAKKLAEIKEMNASGKSVINLGIGSPDLSPHPEVVNAMIQALNEKDAHQYQAYKGISLLTQAFASWYQTHFDVKINADEQVYPLIGSKEGVMHISFTFLSEGDEVLVPNPGYPAYSMAAKLAGAKVLSYDLESGMGWLPDLKKLVQLDLSKVKLMWINYPNMPTGGNAHKSFYDELISFAKNHDILICSDNPYTFILNDEKLNIMQCDEAINHVLELTSLSKNYNMAGWRIGAVTGRKEYINALLQFKSNMDSGMFKPIQLAAVKALSLGSDWFSYLNKQYIERKRVALEIMDILECKYDSNAVGMFIWAKIPNHYKNGEELSEEIFHRERVFITPGHVFGSNGDSYLRISLCGDLSIFQQAKERILNLKKSK